MSNPAIDTGMITGILGHDLRKPLATILTAARLAVARDESNTLLKPLPGIFRDVEATHG